MKNTKNIFRLLNFLLFTLLINESFASSPKVSEWFSDWNYEVHPKIGFRHRAPSTIQHTKYADKELIFDVIYNTDQFSRRVVPGIDKTKATNKFILYLGCSFTYGFGVNDHETIPAYIWEHHKSHMPYNYAISGSGPHTMLGRLQFENIQEQIQEEQGLILYFYHRSHPARANGFMKQISWNKFSPLYTKNSQGDLIYSGIFKERWPIRTFALETIETLFELIGLNDRNLPSLKDTHIDYVCDIVKEIEKTSLNLFSKGQFHFVNFTGEEINERLYQCLMQNKISIINVKFDYKPSYSIPYDGHFTALGNQAVAKALSELLKL